MARSRFTLLSSLASILLLTTAGTLPAQSQSAQPSVTAKPGEWRYLNGDPLATRYSPLDQITRDNFKNLKIAWRWKPAIPPAAASTGGTAQGNGDPKLARYRSEATPVMANGVLYWIRPAANALLPRSMRRPGSSCGMWQGRGSTKLRPRYQGAPRAATLGRGVAYWTDWQGGADFRQHDWFLSRRARCQDRQNRPYVIWRQRRRRPDEGAERRFQSPDAHRLELAGDGVQGHADRPAGAGRGLHARLDA